MSRCTQCRGMGFTFDSRTNHGENCPSCGGTGVAASSKDIPPAIRAQVRERSGGVCEVCHSARATDQHHRQFRSRASRDGAHTVENLVDICGPGNAFGCHADAHGSKPPEGLAINSWEHRAIADIPFMDKLGARWLLHVDGTKELAA